MKKICRNIMVMVVVAASIVATSAHASVVISGTRVIYPGNEREVTIKLTNEGKAPALVQAWLDTGQINESPSKIEVPFTLTPPIFRMDPGKGQSLRLSYTKEPLPQDRESLFWLNVLELPPKHKTSDDINTLQMAFRTRIKVLFRPQGLPGVVDDAPARMKWEVIHQGSDYVLKATNPTPYFVNMARVALVSGGASFDAGQGYVRPFDSQQFVIQGLKSAPAVDAKVDYTSINDYGAPKDDKQSLTAAGSH
jgi:chaperone protein EcpD